MSQSKNRKVNIGGTKYKVHETVYKYMENIANVLQMHEIAMLGWAKNCYEKVDQQYTEEFYRYIMSIPHAVETIKKMEEADKKQNESKETSEKGEEVEK
tara:strand:- start:7101 stop:7397 length:297 start_codon:yes stop_codon:yes gene_type:complete